jgi:phosphoglycolate phosphatase
MVELVAGARAVECRLVIFDKNGTLVDQQGVLLALARARRNAINRNSGEKIAEHWEKAVGVNLRTDKIDNSGPLATLPRREELLVAATVLYLSDVPWRRAIYLASKAYDKADDSMQPPYGSVLFGGIADMLQRLKKRGFKLAVASTDTHRRTEESFKALGVDGLFDVVVGSDDVARGKPHADMVLEACRIVGTGVGETVVVGDSLSDIEMGLDAGVKSCIGVLTGSATKEELQTLTDIVINSAAELGTSD